MKKPARKTVMAVILLGLLALLALAFSPKPVEVETAVVSRGRFERVVEEEGRTRVRERYVVSAPLAGRLLRIQLDPGNGVKKGDLLAVMVPSAPALLDVRTERELQERLGAAEADRLRAQTEVERARAGLEQARSDFQRISLLAKDGLVPAAQLEREALALQLRERELQSALFGEEFARHQEALARAALVRARKGFSAAGERLEILSPVSGQVLRIFRESEGAVAMGTSLLEIGDPADLEVVTDLLTTDAVEVRPEMPARIVRYGGPVPLDARVRLVEPAAFTKVSALGIEEQRVNVLIDLVSPYAQWKMLGDGFRVEAQVVVFAEENALIIPSGALFREGDRWALFVVSGGRARKEWVRVAQRSGSEAMIEEGLSAGQEVIVYPGDGVREGVKVRPRH
ncbi:MAG TPA: HlyD family efflux transporter periplasmic adaptor subunit [Candidatus Manganitrophaceae bacterium]|nr:HlyD family efflux transporter periplasmic adaptor subunit [Candidatus Manganitrophaceae bacterium]